MATLLLRLAGPLQSWGHSSKFERRTTGREPTKSGVVGLLAAALGRGREESVDDLNALKFGVRIESAGQLLRDYQTATSAKNSYVTERYYLADAVFIVGVEGDREFLEEIENAVKSPVYPLFLGRRSCPPVGPICCGIRDWPLMQVLEKTVVGDSDVQACEAKVIVVDADTPTAIRRRDFPHSFDQAYRKHDFRYITEIRTHHDAFNSGLEGSDDIITD